MNQSADSWSQTDETEEPETNDCFPDAFNIIDLIKYMSYTSEKLEKEIAKVIEYDAETMTLMFDENNPNIKKKEQKSRAESKEKASIFISTFFNDKNNRKSMLKDTPQETTLAYTKTWNEKIDESLKDKYARAILTGEYNKHTVYTIQMFRIYLNKLLTMKKTP